MILIDEKLSAPTTKNGRFYMLYRWRCSACNRYGVYLLNAEEVKQHGATHAAAHLSEASP